MCRRSVPKRSKCIIVECLYYSLWLRSFGNNSSAIVINLWKPFSADCNRGCTDKKTITQCIRRCLIQITLSIFLFRIDRRDHMEIKLVFAQFLWCDYMKATTELRGVSLQSSPLQVIKDICWVKQAWMNWDFLPFLWYSPRLSWLSMEHQDLYKNSNNHLHFVALCWMRSKLCFLTS